MSTKEIRYEQLKEIKKNIEAFIHLDAPNTELKDHIVLLTGDLNIFPEEEEYKFIKLAIPSSKNLAKNNQAIAGTCFDENGSVKPKMLDHIISIGKCIEGESEIIDAVQYPISDHLAVQGNIKI